MSGLVRDAKDGRSPQAKESDRCRWLDPEARSIYTCVPKGKPACLGPNPRMTRKYFLETARGAAELLAEWEEEHGLRRGFYTRELQDLGMLTGELTTFTEDISQLLFDVRIDAREDSFRIRVTACDAGRTVISVDGPRDHRALPKGRAARIP